MNSGTRSQCVLLRIVQTSLVTSLVLHIYIYTHTQDGPLPARSSRVISQLRVITPITHV